MLSSARRLTKKVSPPKISCGTVLAPLQFLPFPVDLPHDVAHIRDSPIALIPPATSEGIQLGHREEGGPTDDVVLGPRGDLGLHRAQPRVLCRLPRFRAVEAGEAEAGIAFAGPRDGRPDKV